MESAVQSQREIIFFLYKEGASGADITRRLNNVFGSRGLNKTSVYKWIERFNGGRGDCEDDTRSGRPSTSKTEENMLKVNEMIQNDRRVTVREIAYECGVAKTQVHLMLKAMNYSKLTAR